MPDIPKTSIVVEFVLHPMFQCIAKYRFGRFYVLCAKKSSCNRLFLDIGNNSRALNCMEQGKNKHTSNRNFVQLRSGIQNSMYS